MFSQFVIPNEFSCRFFLNIFEPIWRCPSYIIPFHYNNSIIQVVIAMDGHDSNTEVNL